MHLRYPSTTLSSRSAQQGNFTGQPGQGPPPNGGQSQPPATSGGSYTTSIIVVIVVVVVVLGVLISYAALRRLRISNKDPKYIPTSFLKRKWSAWSPGHRRARSLTRGQNVTSTNTGYNTGIDESEAGNTAAGGIDRNTSVRSVMTLPAYSQVPKDTEQVLGREGEREGMDTVVEFPETVEEEEGQREEEMASLYQIRLARRQEIAERERRRQERHEARDRGDWARLEELRRDSRARAAAASQTNLNDGANGSTTNLTSAMLLAEHQSRGRDRRVSSVTYADVGHVRHDGTRLRADSDGSETGRLLDGAAPMGDATGRSRGNSDAASTLTMPRPPFRDRSASSALSVSTTASDLEDSALRPLTPQSMHRAASSLSQIESANNGSSSSPPLTHRLTPEHSTDSEDAAAATATAAEAGLGEPGPPTYEEAEWGEAPAYEAAILRRESERIAAAQRRGTAHAQSFSPVSPVVPEDAPLGPPPGDMTQVTRQAPQLQLHLPSIKVEEASQPSTPVP